MDIFSIDVAIKIGETLGSKEQGRDLFILVYDSIGDHDAVELDFIDCDDIKPEFLEGFITASHSSVRLPISVLEEKVIFSGLYYDDIKALHLAILAAKNEKDTQQQIESVIPELRKAIGKIQHLVKR